MKANNGKGNIPERDEWETKQELFDKLNKQYGFIFDCCATEKNTKCPWWSEDFIDTKKNLNAIQPRCSWMNPPFSKANIMFKHFFEVIDKGVAIYRCDNIETALWQKVILPNCSWIFIPDKRVSYEGLDGNGARFPSALIGVGVEPPKNLEGTTLTVIKR